MDNLPPARPRFAFLEGVRGLAALYVVIHHAAAEFLFSSESGAVPASFREWAWLFLFERYAVDCFIVLSGFCLALPVLNRPGLRLEGGFLRFMGRRARRILPAYYGALAVCLALNRWVPGLAVTSSHPGRGLRWDMTSPAFDKNVLLSHLLLVHNAKDAWAFKIDYPMWSVATEWQIYFLFPVLILLWRYAGEWALLVGAYAIGFWVYAGPELLPGNASSWYLGLFAMGMVAARIAQTPGALEGPAYKRTVALLLAELALYRMVLFAGRAGELAQPLRDTLIGVMAALLIVTCARDARSQRRGPLLRALESGPLQGLGHFAYSLYLIHAPVLALAHLALLNLFPDTPTRMLWMFAGAVPLSVLTAWAFARLFERPFLQRRVPDPKLAVSV